MSPRPSSGPRNARYARKWHAAMIATLGGRCAWCRRTDRLELDHIAGRSWEPRALSWHRRITRYRAELAAGPLQVPCRSCNALKGVTVEKPARARRAVVETEPDWVREG